VIPPGRKPLIASVVVLALAALAGPATRAARSLRMTRGALATYAALLDAANVQDLGAVRSLCARGYLAGHPPAAAPGGGVVGLPRTIHRNFQAWRQVDEVWLCPTDRVGPVYRFVEEGGGWKFAGVVGLLRAGGRVERMDGDRDGAIP